MKEKILNWMFENVKQAHEIVNEFMTIQNFRELPIGESINQLFGLRLIKKDEKTLHVIGSIFGSVESFIYFRESVEPILEKHGIAVTFEKYTLTIKMHE